MNPNTKWLTPEQSKKLLDAYWKPIDAKKTTVVRACRKEYLREYYLKRNKSPEAKQKSRERSKRYFQDPETKARRQEYMRNYRQRPEVRMAKKLGIPTTEARTRLKAG